jgi:hypothetical protein
VSAPHLDEDTWERLAMNQLAAPARAEALRHVMACARCRTIYRGVLALEESAREAGLGPPRRAAPATRWLLAGGATLAAVAAVLLVWWRIGTSDAPSGPALRGAPAVITVRAVARIEPGRELSWAAVAAAHRYRVEIFAEDGQPVWLGESAAPSIAWPAAASTPGAYRWRVEALDEGGAVVARSPLTAVELAR